MLSQSIAKTFQVFFQGNACGKNLECLMADYITIPCFRVLVVNFYPPLTGGITAISSLAYSLFTAIKKACNSFISG